MDKSTTWILVAVLLAFIVLGGSKTTRTLTIGPGSRIGPVGGPSPLGTSWAQQGPYTGATAQSNGYDLGKTAIQTAGSVIVGLAQTGAFTPTQAAGSGDTAPSSDDTYDTSFGDSLS